MGEYDTSTTDDGEHQDIKISKVQPHEDFEPELFLNDIAILNLEREVVFNGKVHGFLSFFGLYRVFLSLVSCLFADRIRPICLPLSKELINRRFVGYTPFLGKLLIVKFSKTIFVFKFILIKLVLSRLGNHARRIPYVFEITTSTGPCKCKQQV